MTGATPLPSFGADELLARFIIFKKWLRADQSVRPDAFFPPNDLNLSVTRHGNLIEPELWKLGQQVADAVSLKRDAKLCGRADVTVQQVTEQKLSIVAFPLTDNPNHTHITDWPVEKPVQKALAQELAKAAGKCVLPE
jgi:hypothetical protein